MFDKSTRNYLIKKLKVYTNILYIEMQNYDILKIHRNYNIS